MAQSAPQSSQDGLQRPHIVQIGPLAQVQCTLSNEGEWMLRKYSNGCGTERIRLERLHSAQHEVQGTKQCDVTSAPEIRKGVIVKPSRDPKPRASDTDKNSHSPTKAGSFAPSSQPSEDSQIFFGTTPRKVRLRDDSPTAYDPRAVAEEDDMNPEHIPIPQTSNVFKGTATSGYDRPCFKSQGEWYFQTAGGDDTDQSSETIAALEMGGQGIFEPDTNRPTAEEVHNYQKCYKRFGKGLTDRSQGITVVWKPNSDKPTHQQTSPGTLIAEDVLGGPGKPPNDTVSGPLPERRDSNRDETSVSPRSKPNSSLETDQQADEDDYSKLVPPPATALEPTANSSKRFRTSIASASSRRSTGQGFIREDTPHPSSTRKESAKRKSSEAGSGSGSPPKALKLDSNTKSSSRTSWPNKNSLGHTLKVYDTSLKKPGIGKGGGDATAKLSTETVAEESEVETGAKETDEEKKKEQDRDGEKEAGEDSEV